MENVYRYFKQALYASGELRGDMISHQLVTHLPRSRTATYGCHISERAVIM
jgi:hypothetical protein